MTAKTTDLFQDFPINPKEKTKKKDYDASSIRVLEGLEPVRLRPGMYIGGTDKTALHHLFAEVIDNAMDEAVAGYANIIEVTLDNDNCLTVSDNGRGIPVENHPQMPEKSTLEVILTQLHSGGKFDGDAYTTSGGLHGVGISVVNALSENLEVSVIRNKKLYQQHYSRGLPCGTVQNLGTASNRKGTKIRFSPDPEIFGENVFFDPKLLYKMTQAKAYLFNGVKIRWFCSPEKAKLANISEQEIFHYPNGLKDYLLSTLGENKNLITPIFSGQVNKRGDHGALEWAIAWHPGDNFLKSYCNTIATKEGGTHEQGLKYALLRALKKYGELIHFKKAFLLTSEDILQTASIILSVFIREPEFVGQTKNRLATSEAQKIVESALRDPFDHWLAKNPNESKKLLEFLVLRAEERLRRKQEKEVNRKTATRKLRLPGKLADCTQNSAKGAELFIVEGDSAGGSAKQARNRITQAILPLRGKILNVASAGSDKILNNQLLSDLTLALGCGTASRYKEQDLRYEKIIIMTDADVDGAHIASLIITFFYKEMPELIQNGHLYLAVPPLYRISQGGKIFYAKDDSHKELILKTKLSSKGKIEISRFKGLGEMRSDQLKETTMDPKSRNLLRISLLENDFAETEETVESLMGTRAEARFQFIQENAAFVHEVDI